MTKLIVVLQASSRFDRCDWTDDVGMRLDKTSHEGMRLKRDSGQNHCAAAGIEVPPVLVRRRIVDASL
jgi:hypothetical protein